MNCDEHIRPRHGARYAASMPHFSGGRGGNLSDRLDRPGGKAVVVEPNGTTVCRGDGWRKEDDFAMDNKGDPFPACPCPAAEATWLEKMKNIRPGVSRIGGGIGYDALCCEFIRASRLPPPSRITCLKHDGPANAYSRSMP